MRSEGCECPDCVKDRRAADSIILAALGIIVGLVLAGALGLLP